MRSSRIVLNLVVLAAAVFLSGCYVATKNLPAGEAFVDRQLIGAWEALNQDGSPSSDMTFLHFMKPVNDGELVLIMVDDRGANTYGMHSIKIGDKQLFALKLMSTTKSDKSVEDEEPNYILGLYEVKGDEINFNLLDSRKFKAFVAAHKLRGKAEKSDYGKVTLTGSPQELADFFAETDVKSMIGDEKPARARRISRPKH
ncbi:MAG: hypothetical protein GC190_01015 [Alphaproteobacteria bacterium]|nr:hypothetical protein [Alphaproteobacteria bacterium]